MTDLELVDEFGARSDAKATSLNERKRVFVAESSLDHHVGGPVEGRSSQRAGCQPSLVSFGAETKRKKYAHNGGRATDSVSAMYKDTPAVLKGAVDELTCSVNDPVRRQ